MEKKPISVLFGSMTGNSEDLAERTVKRLKSEGHDVSLHNLDSYDPAELAKLKRAIIVISTWGEGDPPDECEDFCFALYDGKVPNLAGVEHCVLALGDSSYDEFCGCGKKVDDALVKAGSKRFFDRKDLDVDFDDDFAAWADALVKKLAS